MHGAEHVFLPPKQAAEALGVSCATLRQWARHEKIQYRLTAGGHRRFDIKSVQRCKKKAYTYNLPRCLAKQQANPENQVGAIYCRVSSTKQADDLKRQIESIQQLYPKHQVFRDICSGLKYKRPGLSRLLERVREGLVKEVVVAHKDRLARFGTELIEWIMQKAGARLIVLD